MRTAPISLLCVLSTLLLLPIGCTMAPAGQSGQWSATDWKPTETPLAKVVEPPPSSKPAETSPVDVQTRREAVLPAPEPSPEIVQPSPPVATLPEAKPVIEDKPKAETKPVDEAQVSRERAQATLTLLENTSSGVRAAVCSARSLLTQVPDTYRQEPLVVEAHKRLKAKEPAALREEQAEFEPNRMYLCRDGTPSPTCHCNGPKRGCCSHHQGVVGCEPLPTAITCP